MLTPNEIVVKFYRSRFHLEDVRERLVARHRREFKILGRFSNAKLL